MAQAGIAEAERRNHDSVTGITACMTELPDYARQGNLGRAAMKTLLVGIAFANMSRPTAVIAILQINSTKDEITGTISQTEPPIQQDGTPAHPYSDASQCPARTDLVFWPSGRSVPSIPPSISVCFVGDRSSANGGSDVEVRDR